MPIKKYQLKSYIKIYHKDITEVIEIYKRITF
jgi:hypothetical protein